VRGRDDRGSERALRLGPLLASEHEVNYNKETRAKAIVSRNGKLIPEVFEVLDLIKERTLTLARIIVTHPLLGPQFTNMSLQQMQKAVKLGGAIEITAGTVSRDGAGLAIQLGR